SLRNLIAASSALPADSAKLSRASSAPTTPSVSTLTPSSARSIGLAFHGWFLRTGIFEKSFDPLGVSHRNRLGQVRGSALLRVISDVSPAQVSNDPHFPRLKRDLHHS